MSTPPLVIDSASVDGSRDRHEEMYAEPSRVLCARNIPPEAAESEVAALVTRLGYDVVRILMLRKRSVAFIQTAKRSYATKIKAQYDASPPLLHGRRIYFAFSNRDRISSSKPVPGSLDAELHAPAVLHKLEADAHGGDDAASARHSESTSPSKVLLVTVSHVLYPVDVAVMKRVFGGYGVLEKIVTFPRDSSACALIQYDSETAAEAALEALHGHCIYANCNKMRIQYSKMPYISVRYNNMKSYDFTKPYLPPSPLPGTMEELATRVATPVIIVSGFSPGSVTPDELFKLFGVYGNILRVKIMWRRQDTALIQYMHPMCANFAKLYLHGVPLAGKLLKVNNSSHFIVNIPQAGQPGEQLTQDYTSSLLHRFPSLQPSLYAHLCPPTDHVVFNDMPSYMSVQDLANMVHSFFPVKAVKLLDARTGAVLLGMHSVESAVHTLIKLHGCPWPAAGSLGAATQADMGNYIKVSFTRGRMHNVSSAPASETGVSEASVSAADMASSMPADVEPSVAVAHSTGLVHPPAFAPQAGQFHQGTGRAPPPPSVTTEVQAFSPLQGEVPGFAFPDVAFSTQPVTPPVSIGYSAGPAAQPAALAVPSHALRYSDSHSPTGSLSPARGAPGFFRLSPVGESTSPTLPGVGFPSSPLRLSASDANTAVPSAAMDVPTAVMASLGDLSLRKQGSSMSMSRRTSASSLLPKQLSALTTSTVVTTSTDGEPVLDDPDMHMTLGFTPGGQVGLGLPMPLVLPSGLSMGTGTTDPAAQSHQPVSPHGLPGIASPAMPAMSWFPMVPPASYIPVSMPPTPTSPLAGLPTPPGAAPVNRGFPSPTGPAGVPAAAATATAAAAAAAGPVRRMSRLSLGARSRGNSNATLRASSTSGTP